MLRIFMNILTIYESKISLRGKIHTIFSKVKLNNTWFLKKLFQPIDEK